MGEAMGNARTLRNGFVAEGFPDPGTLPSLGN